jgi:hypothetical protein
MPSYSPELIQIMRAALDEVMTQIPVEQVTPGLKAHMAEVILTAAAEGQTSYDGLLASASDQIPTILSTDVSSKKMPAMRRSLPHQSRLEAIRFTNKIVVITGGRAGLLRVA